MREIKFRAKNVMNGEWVCGDLVHYNHSHTHISIAEKECKEQYFVHPETVGQFIGIKDSKGRKIDEHIVAVIHGRNFGKTKWMQEQLRKAIKNEFERLPDGTVCYLQCDCCNYVNAIRKKDLGDLDNPEFHCKECGRRLI